MGNTAEINLPVMVPCEHLKERSEWLTHVRQAYDQQVAFDVREAMYGQDSRAQHVAQHVATTDVVHDGETPLTELSFGSLPDGDAMAQLSDPQFERIKVPAISRAEFSADVLPNGAFSASDDS